MQYHERTKATSLDKKINSILEPDYLTLGEDHAGRSLHWQPSALTTTLNRTTTRKFLSLESDIKDPAEARVAYHKIEKYLSGLKFRTRKTKDGTVAASPEEKLRAIRACLKVVAGCCLSGKSKTRHWVLQVSPGYFERWLQSSGFIRLTEAEVRTVHRHTMGAVAASGLALPSGKRKQDKINIKTGAGKSVNERKKDYTVISRIKFAGEPCGIRIDLGGEQSFFAAIGEASKGSFITATGSSDHLEIEHGLKISVPKSALGHGALLSVAGMDFVVENNDEGQRAKAVGMSSGAQYELVSQNGDVFLMRMTQAGSLVRARYGISYNPSLKELEQAKPVDHTILKKLSLFSGTVTLVKRGEDSAANIGLNIGGLVSCLSQFDKRLDEPVSAQKWEENFITDEEERLEGSTQDTRKIRDIFCTPFYGNQKKLFASSYLYCTAKQIPDELDFDSTALEAYNAANPERQISCLTLHSNGAVTAKLTFTSVAKQVLPGPAVKALMEDTFGIEVLMVIRKTSPHRAHVPSEGACRVLADIDKLENIRVRNGALNTHAGATLGIAAEETIYGL